MITSTEILEFFDAQGGGIHTLAAITAEFAGSGASEDVKWVRASVSAACDWLVDEGELVHFGRYAWNRRRFRCPTCRGVVIFNRHLARRWGEFDRGGNGIRFEFECGYLVSVDREHVDAFLRGDPT